MSCRCSPHFFSASGGQQVPQLRRSPVPTPVPHPISPRSQAKAVAAALVDPLLKNEGMFDSWTLGISIFHSLRLLGGAKAAAAATAAALLAVVSELE